MSRAFVPETVTTLTDNSHIDGTIIYRNERQVEEVITLCDCPMPVHFSAPQQITLTVLVSPEGNDIPCHFGVTTYSFILGSNVGCTVFDNGDGTFYVTATACEWIFLREMFCNGRSVGTAPVTGSISSISLFPSSENLIDNGDFSVYSLGPVAPGNDVGGGWKSDLPYNGSNSYVVGDGATISTGDFFPQPAVGQVPFPGDSLNDVPVINTFWYSNGNQTGGPYRSVYRTISLVAGRQYQVSAYTSNAILPGNDFPFDPMIDIRVDGVTLGSFRERDHSDPLSSDAGFDLWHRREFTWTATFTGTVAFEIWDSATGDFGDDFAITQIAVRELLTCEFLTPLFKNIKVPVKGQIAWGSAKTTSDTQISWTAPFTGSLYFDVLSGDIASNITWEIQVNGVSGIFGTLIPNSFNNLTAVDPVVVILGDRVRVVNSTALNIGESLDLTVHVVKA